MQIFSTDESFIATMEVQQKLALAALLRESREHYIRFFFKLREGTKFQCSQHHRLLHETLAKVYSGEIKRLIINMPPGYTKTEEAVIAFISGGLAINPRAKFIHSSYSRELVSENSTKTKDTILLPEFQELYPMKLRSDTKAKLKWYTQYGGGMLAAASGSAITGFRAGRMEPGFTGAFIWDDPLKPDDAYSDPKRNKINQRYNSTMKSRLAHEDIPVVVIMQRLHDNDLTGFLLSGGSGEKWHHLELPVWIAKEPMTIPNEWTHRIPIEVDLPPGPLWEAKHNKAQIEILKNDPYSFASQYMQRPAPLGGGIFKDSWWEYYDEIPDLRAMMVYSDTASKTAEHNDYSVFTLVGLTRDRKLCILDVLRGKWEAPELLTTAKAFWMKAKLRRSMTLPGAKRFAVEDKSSGIGLIQQLKKEIGAQSVRGVPRDIDKVRRAMGCVKEIYGGNVLLPSKPTILTDGAWVSDFKDEFRRFTVNDTHAYDDQIDTVLDAIEELLVQGMGGFYDNVRK